MHGKSVERPQHLLMRAACGIHCGDLKATLETYDLMSRKFFTHATPTLFNSGTPKPQMSSCFLLKMKEDSIEGIYDTLKQCALISKSVLWQTLGTFWERYEDFTWMSTLSKFLCKSFEPQRLVVLVLPFPMSAPVDPMCVVRMVTAMDWCPCCATSMRLHGMWTKVEENVRDPLPCILGTQVTKNTPFFQLSTNLFFGDCNGTLQKLMNPILKFSDFFLHCFVCLCVFFARCFSVH